MEIDHETPDYQPSKFVAPSAPKSRSKGFNELPHLAPFEILHDTPDSGGDHDSDSDYLPNSANKAGEGIKENGKKRRNPKRNRGKKKKRKKRKKYKKSVKNGKKRDTGKEDGGIQDEASEAKEEKGVKGGDSGSVSGDNRDLQYIHDYVSDEFDVKLNDNQREKGRRAARNGDDKDAKDAIQGNGSHLVGGNIDNIPRGEDIARLDNGMLCIFALFCIDFLI